MKKILEVNQLSKMYLIDHLSRAKNNSLTDFLGFKLKATLPVKVGEKTLDSNFSPKEEFWALKNVTFSIEEGDRVAIIGKNGAGKSTLLKILSRITQPTSGSAKIFGRMTSLLEVGTGFHPDLSGRENIFLNGAILGMPASHIRKKFDEIVEFSEIEKFLDTPVKFYSSGMYVRLAFSVAVHMDPEILILDEVLSVGDSNFQKKCKNKMSEITNSGATLIYVSHGMESVQEICTKGILLEGGSVKAFDEVSKVVSIYDGRSKLMNI